MGDGGFGEVGGGMLLATDGRRRWRKRKGRNKGVESKLHLLADEATGSCI